MIGEQSSITRAGAVAGTAKYMSPEQIHGENIDHRTDIWSLGAVLYEMTAGVPPFKSEYEQAVIYSILNENPAPLKKFRDDIPEEFEEAVQRALAKKPFERYQNMKEFIKDIKLIKKKLNFDNEQNSLSHLQDKDYRKLAAIMFTDIVGYSALMQKNETLALEMLKEHREILRSLFVMFDGVEIETAGDSFFVEFASAVDAAKCAVEIQRRMYDRNHKVSDEKKIFLRIGLHVGDVIHTKKHVHGDGVNLAARIEPLAQPGCICISEDAARQIKNKIDFPLVKVGKKKLKNIELPMNVYKIVLPWELQNRKQKFFISRSISFFKLNLITAVLIALAFIGYFFIKSNEEKTENEYRNRIAVLPFANISSENEDEYFADGITEEIISNLAKISGLDVIARTSVMKYKKTSMNVAQIGHELMVGTILEGSVRKAANKARITVQLIDVPTQRHLWSDEYDRELKDIFMIQSDIAMKVADELKVQLLADEKEMIEKKGTESTDAYRYYLLGNYFLNRRTGESLNKGIEYFKKAIEYDPNFPHAYAGLANCYTLIGGAAYGKLSREEASEKANDAVLTALELDASLAEAHASLGYIMFRFDWNWNEAEREFKKAIDLKPAYAAAHEWYALLFSIQGRHDDALKEMNRAYELDPLSPSISTGVGRIMHFANKLDDAEKQYKKTLEIYPNYAEAHFALSMTYTSKKRYNEALKEIDKAIELSNGRLVMISMRGMIYGFAGKRKEALAVIDELGKLSLPDPVSPYHLSSIYFSLGERDKYFENVHKAYEQRDPLMIYIKTTPVFATYLNNDPRFHEILKKMRLE
jgi:TolB-like protein/class 3 adenylate cyclase/Tfp pilus assembly protein PilF